MCLQQHPTMDVWRWVNVLGMSECIGDEWMSRSKIIWVFGSDRWPTWTSRLWLSCASRDSSWRPAAECPVLWSSPAHCIDFCDSGCSCGRGCPTTSASTRGSPRTPGPRSMSCWRWSSELHWAYFVYVAFASFLLRSDPQIVVQQILLRLLLSDRGELACNSRAVVVFAFLNFGQQGLAFLDFKFGHHLNYWVQVIGDCSLRGVRVVSCDFLMVFELVIDLFDGHDHLAAYYFVINLWDSPQNYVFRTLPAFWGVR